jgi:hypothetical protein
VDPVLSVDPVFPDDPELVVLLLLSVWSLFDEIISLQTEVLSPLGQPS